MNLLNKLKTLSKHQGFQRYLKNTSWMMGEQMLRIIAGLLVGIWVARYLGPEQFGRFSYVLAFSSIFAGIAKLGLDNILVRELVNHPEQRDIHLGTAFWLKIIGAFLVMGFVAVAVQFTSNDAITNFYISIICAGLLFQSFEVIEFYFQSQILAKFVSICKVIQLTLSSILKIYLVLTQAELIDFVMVVLFDAITLAIALFFAYQTQKNINFYKRFDLVIASKLLKYSWPLIFSGFVLMIQARIDQVMIKEMIGEVEVGYYSVALKIIEIFAFIPIVLMNSLLPSIINSKNNSEKIYQNRLLNFYRLNFLLFLIVSIPIYLFSDIIVTMLFGIEYQNASILLSLMTVRLFFANMGVARGAFILVENLLKFSLITMLLGTVTNIVLNYFWIEKYGSQGAILATMASMMVTIFLIDVIYSQTRLNIYSILKAMITFYRINLGK